MPYLGNDLSVIVKQGKVAYKFVATSGQTVFTGNDANGLLLELTADSFVTAYLNGVLLIKTDDYTLTTNTFTLGTAASLNDELVIVRDIDSSTFTSYTKTETDTVVTNAVNGLVDAAPTALNTLNELAAALNDDANFASTITTALSAKADTSSLGSLATKNTVASSDINDSAIITSKIADANITTAKMEVNNAGKGTLFSAYHATIQNISSSTTTKLNYDVELHDPDNNYNPSTSTWTAPIAGWYWLSANMRLSPGSNFRFDMAFYVNGSVSRSGGLNQTGSNDASSFVTTVLYLNAGEQVTVYMNQNSGGTTTTNNSSNVAGGGATGVGRFEGFLIRAA